MNLEKQEQLKTQKIMLEWNKNQGLNFISVVTKKEIDFFLVVEQKRLYAIIKSRTGFRYLLSEKKLNEAFHNAN